MTVLPGAPGPGARLADAAAAASPGVHSVVIDDFPVLILRDAAGLRAFANLCPHQFLPLDHRAPAALSVDGGVLRCSNHAAGFDAKTGAGVEGLGLGCALTPIAVEERAGGIFVAG